MNNKKITIVSGGDEIRLRSYVNHKIFSLEHGFDYRLEIGLGGKIESKFDYKFNCILNSLGGTDWLIWVDDDVYFTDFVSENIEMLINGAEIEGNQIILAEGPLEPNGFWSKINTGVMIIRNSDVALGILEKAKSTPLEEVKAGWSDANDGLYTNGDQDQLWHVIREDGLVDSGVVRIVGHSLLNSRGHYYKSSLSDNFAMHFCGYPDKELGVSIFAKNWEIGQEIVPRELLDKYGVSVRSPLGGMKLVYRREKQKRISAVKYYLRPYKNKFYNYLESRSG